MPDTAEGVSVPKDTVYDELRESAKKAGGNTDDISMAIAVYLLGFSTYMGFANDDGTAIDLSSENSRAERLYHYAKEILKLR